MNGPATQDQIDAIIRTLQKRGSSPALVEQASALSRVHPEAVLALARTIIRQVPADRKLLYDSLSFLPEDDWGELVEFALDAFDESSDNQAADVVLLVAAQQALPALHPHLERYFWRKVKLGWRFDVQAWRDSGTTSLSFLRGIIETSESDETRQKAWDAMVETRDPTMIAEAIKLAKHLELFSNKPADDLGWCREFFLEQGYVHDGSGLRRLVSDSVYHLVFPVHYFDEMWRGPEPGGDDFYIPPPPKRVHPTWSLEPTPDLPTMRFGGLAEVGRCGECGERLHRIICLDPIPEGIGISGLSRLEIATCLSCGQFLSSGLFYRHDESGRASDLGEHSRPGLSEAPIKPLREVEVRLAASPRRWYWQYPSEGEENLNRLGGECSHVTYPYFETCKICGDWMRFVMQLDSFLPLVDGGEWWWSVCGLGHIFWFDRCKVSCFRTQEVT